MANPCSFWIAKKTFFGPSSNGGFGGGGQEGGEGEERGITAQSGGPKLSPLWNADVQYSAKKQIFSVIWLQGHEAWPVLGARYSAMRY